MRIIRAMSLVGLFKRPGPNGFGYGSTAEEVTEGIDLTGKTYLLTGCASGLGEETLRVLGLRGAHVLASARTEDKARAALDRTGASGTPVACDLSEPATVRRAVAQILEGDRTLDGIIANAGIMALPKLETKHGLELQFLTNHIGHFILVTGVLDKLADDGRVVILSSDAHRAAPSEGIQFDNLDGAKGYGAWRAYGQSKLANLLFAKHLAKRLPQPEQVANALHPGVIHTNLGRHMNPLFGVALAIAEPLFTKSIPQGAATQCYVATHPKSADITGEYFSDCNVGRPSKHGQDAALASKLWERTEEIVAALPG
jgi:WW domain-containing oxidoreductase